MTRRNSILVVVVALAAAAGAYWMLILSPKRQEAATLNTQIAAKQTALQQAQAELASYEAARAGYKANYSKVAELGKAVPADDDVRSLLVQLNSAADKSKVDFRNIDLGSSSGPAPGSGGTAAAAPGTKTPPPGSSTIGTAGFSTIPFSFAFKGSFFHLGDFFNRLDNFVQVGKDKGVDVTGRLLLLNSITLVPDPQKGFPTISASVTANSYLLPPAQGLLESATAAGLAAPAAGGAAGATPSASATPAPTTTTTTATISGATR